MSTRLPHREKYTIETEHLAMQSINHANSNGDASPPNEEDSPKCDSDEIEELETRGLALRRKSTFAQRSTISKVLFSLSFCFFFYVYYQKFSSLFIDIIWASKMQIMHITTVDINFMNFII